jgi:cellulose synthase/poly-beta-1,6-N-acetylglucosamine synthase-like glycosyltransferase
LFYLELIFFACVGVQVIYLVLFLVAFSPKQKSSSISLPKISPVSIIVCAHDEVENLKELLPLLLNQDYPEFEIIIVNDRSNDDTHDWLLTETTRHSRVRIVNVDKLPDHANGKKYGITLGIRAATHEWIVLTDADCRPASTRWLQQMNSAFHEQTQFVLGYSPYKKEPGLLNLFIRFEGLVTALQYMGFANLAIPYMGVGRNMAYRKSLFMQAKGFRSLLSLTGGDDDLFVNQHANNTNTATVVGREAIVYSIPKRTVGDFVRQKIRHLAAGKRYKFKHKLLLGVFTATWIVTLLLGILLLGFSSIPWIIAGALLLRVIMAGSTLHMASKQLGDTIELGYLVLLDIIYVIYYLSTGTAALLTKRIRWKN